MFKSQEKGERGIYSRANLQGGVLSGRQTKTSSALIKTFPMTESLMHHIADHQSSRIQSGLNPVDYSMHPDSFVRWVAEIGIREGAAINEGVARKRITGKLVEAGG